MERSIFEKNKEIIIQKIKTLENESENQVYLNRIDFTPAKVIQIFESLGYDYEFYNSNGWEQDTEYLLTNEEKRYILNYSGYYFTLSLRKDCYF